MTPSDTRERILDIAQTLLEQRGFNAFSYQDIADRLNIKKASLHYHFASKADLGAALAKRHTERTRERLAEAVNLSPLQKLDFFFEPFLRIARGCDRICAGGMIAAEFPSLDTATQTHMQAFFTTLHTWLTDVLTQGRTDGAFTFTGSPAVKADVMISTLEGMILLSRVRQDASFLEALIKDLKTSLGA